MGRIVLSIFILFLVGVSANICEQYGVDSCSEHSEECVLCKSLGKLDICFEKTIAEKLPKKFFDCNLDPPQPEPLLNVDCQGLDQPSCSKTKGCVWCVSAAVRSACYAEEEASRLPPAVFKCTHPTIFEFSRLGVQ